MRHAAALCLAFLLCACAATNDMLTPSASTFTDDFDGSKIVRQAPVGASGSFSEPVQTLGFEWTAKDPEWVYLTAGVAFGARSGLVTGLAFNADGGFITAEQASPFVKSQYRTQSGVFRVSLHDFERIASAKVVKMRIDGAGQYTVSSFGPEAGGAIVTTKFAPFLDQVRAARGDDKPTR
jgi:hypothetical protein